jgi:peptidoglycan/LPS O-acetylase OafA/YrhL
MLEKFKRSISLLSYRKDIDGLRAIAIILVVFFHAFPERFPGGFLGVDIFFVISGYIITLIILNGIKNNSFTFFEFYLARIRRLFLPLSVVIMTCLLAGYFILLPSEYVQLGKHAVGASFFISNFIYWGESGYFDETSISKPFLHFWSLAVEAQYYVFYPLVIYFICKKSANLIIFLVLMAAASLICSIYLINIDRSAAFYLPYSRFFELFIGSIVAALNFKPAGGGGLINRSSRTRK